MFCLMPLRTGGEINIREAQNIPKTAGKVTQTKGTPRKPPTHEESEERSDRNEEKDTDDARGTTPTPPE